VWGGLPTYLYRWNSFQGYDDAFFNPRHAHDQIWLRFRAHADCKPQLLPTPMESGSLAVCSPFLPMLQPNSKVVSPVSLTPRDIRQNIIAGYVQDDWRREIESDAESGVTLRNVDRAHRNPWQRSPTFGILPIPCRFCGTAVPGCSGTSAFFSNPTLKKL